MSSTIRPDPLVSCQLLDLGEEDLVLQLLGADVDRERQRATGHLRQRQRPAVALAEHPAADLRHQPDLGRDRKHDVGRDVAQVRMGPAQQHLEAVEPAGLDLDDGLPGEPQRLVLERRSQLVLEHELAPGAMAHLGVEDLDAVLAGGLRAVHRDVRAVQQLLGADRLVGERDAHADPEPDDLPVDVERVLHRLDDALAEVAGDVHAVDLVDEDRELVAAEPGGGVRRPQLRTEPVRDRDQHAVAGVVAEPVVDALEPVEVAVEHRDRTAAPHRLGQRVVEPVEEQRPVGQPGEDVEPGQVRDLADQLLPLEHLGGDPGELLDALDLRLAEVVPATPLHHQPGSRGSADREAGADLELGGCLLAGRHHPRRAAARRACPRAAW